MSEEDRHGAVVPETKKPATTTTKIGVFLILMSGVFFFTMLSVPWFPVSSGQKAIIATCLFITVQVSWWVGAALAGPSTLAYFRTFFRRKSND